MHPAAPFQLILGQTPLVGGGASNVPAAGTPAPGATGATGTATTGESGQPLGPGAQGQQAPPNPFGNGFMFIMLGLFGFMIFMSIRGQRKERKRREELLGSIKKHDRVQTQGGMIGTVVELHDTELVLKIDEASGARARFSRGAVVSVLKSSKESNKSSDTELSAK